jgi:hypothetical protein
VQAEGNVSVAVADFGTFDVTTAAQSVAVYKDTRTQVDKSALYAAMTTAGGIHYGGVNTTAAWTDFVNAVNTATTVYGNVAATQTEVNNATAALNTAIAALKYADNSKYFLNGIRIHRIGSTDNLVYIIAHDMALHTGAVKVDGKALTLGTDYTSAAGSTRTTLLASYLDTLSVGTHTLTVEYANGTANISDTFEVLAADDNDNDGNDNNDNNYNDNNTNNDDATDNTGNSNNNNSNNNNNNNSGSSKTGDDMDFALLIALCGGALALLTLLIALRRRAIRQIKNRYI